MGKSCAICDSKDDKTSMKSFHLFPKNVDMRKQWCLIVGFRIENLGKHTVLCSDHFPASDIRYHPSGLKYLVKGALPVERKSPEVVDFKQENPQTGHASEVSLSKGQSVKETIDSPAEESFLIPETVFASTSSVSKGQTDDSSSSDYGGFSKKVKTFQEKLTSSEVSIVSSNSSSNKRSDTSATISASEGERDRTKMKLIRKPLPRSFGDISSDDMRTPRKARSFQIYKKVIIQQRETIAKLKRSNRRLSEKVQNYKKKILFLRENNYLSRSYYRKKVPKCSKITHSENDARTF